MGSTLNLQCHGNFEFCGVTLLHFFAMGIDKIDDIRNRRGKTTM